MAKKDYSEYVVDNDYSQYIVSGPTSDEQALSQELEKHPSKGWSGIASDVWEGVKAAPGAIADVAAAMYESAPEQIMGLGEQAWKDPVRPLKNLAAGGLEGMQSVINLPGVVEGYLREKEILAPGESKLSHYDIDYAEKLGLGEEQPGDVMMRGIAKAAPYVVAGEAGALRGLPRMAARSGAAGAAGASEGINPVTSALMVPMLEGPFRAAAKAKVLPRGRATPSQMAENVRAARGTATPLGDIIQSPALKHLQENILNKMIGSGAEQRQAQIASEIGRRGEQIIGDRAITPGAMNNEFRDVLVDTFKKQEKIKSNLYKPVSDMAKAENLDLDLKSFKKLSKESHDFLKNSPLYSSDPTIRRSINKLASIKDPEVKTTGLIVNEQGIPLTQETIRPTISEANLTANTLYREGSRLSGLPSGADRATGRLYKSLAKALREDVKSNIETKGSAGLKGAYKSATENYRENFSKFLDKDMWKLLNEDKNADAIAREIIKPGQSDKYTNIQKVQRLMPDNQKHVLGRAYLSEAIEGDGSLNLKTLSRNIEKLKPEQFNALFPDEAVRQKLRDFVRLRKMNEEALSAMANPKTGARVLDHIVKGSQAMAVAESAMMMDPLGMIAKGAGPALAGRGLSKIMASQPFREWYINKLLSQGRGATSREALTGALSKLPYANGED